MKFVPLSNRVLVRRTDEEETSEGGIVLPGSAAEKPSQGEVISVGPGKTLDNGDVNAVAVPVTVPSSAAKAIVTSPESKSAPWSAPHKDTFIELPNSPANLDANSP